MDLHNWKKRGAWLLSLSVAAAWPTATWAQEQGEVRQIIINADEDEEKGEAADREGKREEIKLPDYWIGLRCDVIGPEVRAQLNAPEDRGLIVAQVLPESPAAKAGIKDHDILLSANDKPLKEPKDLVDVVAEAKDQELEIKVLRQGKEESIRVKPEKRPESAREGGPVEPGDVLYRIFGENEGDRPIRMRFVHPGMLFPPAGLKHELPDDVRVEITKEGKKPAKITVRRGDKTWNVTEDNLKELPEELRPHISALSGQMPMPGREPFNLRLPAPVESRTRAFREFGEGGQDRVERRFDELNRRMRELQDDLDRLREDRPRRERAPRALGDEADERRGGPDRPRPALREGDGEGRRVPRRSPEDRRDRGGDERDDRDADAPRRGGDA